MMAKTTRPQAVSPMLIRVLLLESDNGGGHDFCGLLMCNELDIPGATSKTLSIMGSNHP